MSKVRAGWNAALEWAAEMLGGACLDLTIGHFTRDDLLRSGLGPDAADELMRFTARLAEKRSGSSTVDRHSAELKGER